MTAQIRAHAPSCRPSPPVVLVEGEEKAGKTWALCELSASPRVGQTYLLELGEFVVEEYGAIPGARFKVLEHDGTYHQVLEQIEAVRAEAVRAHAAGEPPMVLGIDSATDLWEGLSAWVDQRARSFKYNRQRLAQDPDAEVVVPPNLWNDANARHNRIVKLLRTFPGIVVITAKGSDVAEVKNGRPVEGSKVYRVRGQKDLAFAVKQWIRMTRGNPPLVIGAQAVNPILSVRPGDPPVPVDLPAGAKLLDWLIFDAWRYDPATAQVADLRNLTGGELTTNERVDEPAAEEEGRRLATRRYQPQGPEQHQNGNGQQQPSRNHQQRHQQPQSLTPGEQAHHVAKAAISCADLDRLRRTWTEADSRGLLDVDATPALTREQLRELSPTDGGHMTLGEVLKACAGSVEATGKSVVKLLAEPVPGEANPPASPPEKIRPTSVDPRQEPSDDPTGDIVLAAINQHTVGDPSDAPGAPTLTGLLRRATAEQRMNSDVRQWLNRELGQVLQLGDGRQPLPLGAVLHAVHRHLTTGDGSSAAEAATRILANA